ncbi:MAG: hypothetical protein K0R34_670 [Herbinix sp.]|jgi:gas vesicle protein|nr:hypothetical protein [Herbinix sp.]
MDLDKVYDFFSDVEEVIDNVEDKAKDIIDSVGDVISDVGEKISDTVSDAGSNIAEAFENGAKAIYENSDISFLKELREPMEDWAHMIENTSKVIANSIAGLTGVDKHIPDIQVGSDVTSVINTLDILINNYQTNILTKLNAVTTKIDGSNNKEWSGNARVKALVLMDTYEVYASNIGYFYEALKAHLVSLEENVERFDAESSNIRRLKEYQ